ncbi:MAG: hypothetical protein MI810_15350 [Flavobacteriales bacterium]|nr:hypothetical protein [Flavobacteriales bacterium]
MKNSLFILLFLGPFLTFSQENRSGKKIIGFGFETSYQWNSPLKYSEENFSKYADHDLLFSAFDSLSFHEFSNFYSNWGWSGHVDLNLKKDPIRIGKSQGRLRVGLNSYSQELFRYEVETSVNTITDTLVSTSGSGWGDTLYRDSVASKYHTYSAKLRNIGLYSEYLLYWSTGTIDFYFGLGFSMDFSLENKINYYQSNYYQVNLLRSPEVPFPEYSAVYPQNQPPINDSWSKQLDYEGHISYASKTFSSLYQLYVPIGGEIRLGDKGFLSHLGVHGSFHSGIEVGVFGKGLITRRFSGKLTGGIKVYL